MKINLREYRMAAGWTQKKVATDLEISLSYVKKIEQGERSTGLELAKKIADLFGCETIDEIIKAS